MDSEGTAQSGLRRFGVFELDLAARELRKRGVRVRLQDQPFRVLEALLEKPGEIVTREELKDRLWAEDEFVEFDKSLNTSVQKIRQALDDSSKTPRFVETIPRRGYRFVAPVHSAGVAPEPKPRARKIERLALAALATVVLAMAVYIAGQVGRQPVEEAASLSAPSPLTAYPGREIHPSFSPDGEQITFTWEGPNRDNWDIYVKRVGEERANRLTDDPAEDFNSVWSPDGRRIAFVRRYDVASAVVMTVPAIGGPARKVLAIGANVPTQVNKHIRFVTWHPDGRHLVVAMRERRGEPFQLHAVDADTGDARKLMPAESLAEDLDPAVSPDGSKLVFRRRVANFASAVHVVGLSASLEVEGESRKLNGEESESAFLPTWTPDGREIIFTSGFGRSSKLWRAPADGTEPEPFMQPALASFSAVTASGRLALAHIHEDYDVWEFQIATGESRRAVSSTFYDVTPQYSPDGSKIAFSSSRSGYREIWVCDRDGTNSIQLTDLKSRQSSAPYWSPDGAWIVFQSFVGSQRDIFVIRASGGEPRNLTDHPATDVQPTVSRDGLRIYFGSNRSGEVDIWRIAPEGGEPVQVTSQGNAQYALESVDGWTLYYSARSSLWSIPVAGGRS